MNFQHKEGLKVLKTDKNATKKISGSPCALNMEFEH